MKRATEDGKDEDRETDNKEHTKEEGKETDNRYHTKGEDGLKDEDEEVLLFTTDKYASYEKKQIKITSLMQREHSKAKRKKVLTFSPNDLVSVWIPQIGRTSTDLHRVTSMVVESFGTKFNL